MCDLIHFECRLWVNFKSHRSEIFQQFFTVFFYFVVVIVFVDYYLSTKYLNWRTTVCRGLKFRSCDFWFLVSFLLLFLCVKQRRVYRVIVFECECIVTASDFSNKENTHTHTNIENNSQHAHHTNHNATNFWFGIG